MNGMPGAQTGPVPIVRMYGVTQQGVSVLAHVHGFAPYFFVPAPQGFREEDCSKFRVGQYAYSFLLLDAYSNT